MTRRESLLDAIHAALDGDGKPAGLNVFRSRVRALERKDLPALGLYVVSEVVDHDETTTTQVYRRLTWRAEIRALVGSAAPETALDPYVAWAVESAKVDQTFGGLAYLTRELQTEWDAEESDRLYAAATVTFETMYSTSELDLNAAT